MEIDGEAFSPPLFSLSIYLGVSSKLPNSAPKYDGAIFGHKAFSFSLCLSIWGHFIQQWVPESRAPVATTKDELDGGSWRSYLCALEPELEGRKRHKTRGTKIQISLLCAFQICTSKEAPTALDEISTKPSYLTSSPSFSPN